MADTSIQWADVVWNPTTGCDKVSPGCDHCYAMTMAKRLKAMGNPKYQTDGDPRTSGPGFGIAIHPDVLDQPFRWRGGRRVFVNSMSDLFHPRVPDGFIARVWDVMGKNPHHTFMILTKRPKRMRSWVSRWADTAGDAEVGIGDRLPPMPRGPVAHRSVYRSGRAELFWRMLQSMGTPPEGAAYPVYDWMEGQRWWPTVLPNVWLCVSVERQEEADERIPILLDTPAAVRGISAEPLLGPVDLIPWLNGGFGEVFPGAGDLHWVITGGESGADARPANPDWFRAIRDQCVAAGIAYFHKQDGGRTSKSGGRELDGRTWDEYPNSVVTP